MKTQLCLTNAIQVRDSYNSKCYVKSVLPESLGLTDPDSYIGLATLRRNS